MTAGADLVLEIADAECSAESVPVVYILRIADLDQEVNGAQIAINADPSRIEILGIAPGDGMTSPWNNAIEAAEFLDNNRFIYAVVLPGFGTQVDAVLARVTVRPLTSEPLSLSFATPDPPFVTTLTGFPLSNVISPTVIDSAETPLGAPADHDDDGDVDFADFARLQACWTGPAGPVTPPAYSTGSPGCCNRADFDADGDVDALDLASWQAAFTGPTSDQP
jgi:hypothetical protein